MGYFAGFIQHKLYITSEPVTWKRKQISPAPDADIPHLKFFNTTEEIYRYFNIANPEDTLFLFHTNKGTPIYVVAESEELARDKANAWVKERYMNFDYLTGHAEIIAEVTNRGQGAKLVYGLIGLLLFFSSSCLTLHPKHVAINDYLIVDQVCFPYVEAYSPSTEQATTHTNMIIYYPYQISPKDTLKLAAFRAK